MATSNTQTIIEKLSRALGDYKPKVGSRFCCINLDIDALDIKPWFKAQTVLPKVFWSNKNDKEEIAALGAVLKLSHDAELAWLCESVLPNNPLLRLYGGRAFDHRSATWPSFPNSQFILPRIEIRRQGEQYSLICNLSCGDGEWQTSVDETLKLLAELKDAIALESVTQKIISRIDLPNYTQWDKMVSEVTSDDFQAHTAKVVLSRETSIACDSALNAMDLLSQWQQYNPNSFQFIFQFDNDNLFMGCSPERLYRRNKTNLVTEALAGSVSRGKTAEEDEAFADALLNDKKCQYENQLVLDDILSRLHQISLAHYIDPKTSVLKLNGVQHLKRFIKAQINPTLTDYELLDNLHPTPAVGGSPRASALRYIHSHEPYDRGWYAGAVGYISLYNSEFSVAIRSALLEGDNIHLYAGAGIVAGSDPEQEWFELDDKISTVLSILGNS